MAQWRNVVSPVGLAGAAPARLNAEQSVAAPTLLSGSRLSSQQDDALHGNDGRHVASQYAHAARSQRAVDVVAADAVPHTRCPTVTAANWAETIMPEDWMISVSDKL